MPSDLHQRGVDNRILRARLAVCLPFPFFTPTLPSCTYLAQSCARHLDALLRLLGYFLRGFQLTRCMLWMPGRESTSGFFSQKLVTACFPKSSYNFHLHFKPRRNNQLSKTYIAMDDTMNVGRGRKQEKAPRKSSTLFSKLPMNTSSP